MGNTEFKHILVSPKTHKKLANLGKKHESFDKIIAELIELRNMNTVNKDKHSNLKTNTISQFSPKDAAPGRNL
jgi:hypothetical protein